MKTTRFGDYERIVRFEVWSDYDVRIVFTHDIGQSRKARFGDEGAAESAQALHTSAEGGTSFLFFLIGNAPPRVIVHECWHAIFALYEWAGVKQFDNEVTAYHIGWLAGEVFAFRNDLIDSGVKSKRSKRQDGKDSRRKDGGLHGVQPRDRKQETGSTRKNRAGERDPHTGYLYPTTGRFRTRRG